MPALVMDSVVPNDDRDGIAEWSDLHSSCANQEIVVSHRSENRTDLTILEETSIMYWCQIKGNLYPSTANRLRLDLSVDRSNVILSGPIWAHVLAFTGQFIHWKTLMGFLSSHWLIISLTGRDAMLVELQ